MSQYLPIIALAVSVIALALSILIPFIHSRNNRHWDEKELRDKVANAVRERERVERIVVDKVNSNLSRTEQSKNKIDKDLIVNEIIDRLKPEVQKMMSEMIPRMPVPKDDGNAKGSAMPSWKRYGFYGKDSFVLTESPTNTSVYSFVADPKNEQKAWFDVFDVQKVVKDPNLLQDGCCSIEGEGNNLLTLEKGLAVCKDGKWVLDKKLKIKFS